MSWGVTIFVCMIGPFSAAPHVEIVRAPPGAQASRSRRSPRCGARRDAATGEVACRRNPTSSVTCLSQGLTASLVRTRVPADDARLVGVSDRRDVWKVKRPVDLRLSRFPDRRGAPALLRGRGPAEPAPGARRLPGRRAGPPVAAGSPSQGDGPIVDWAVHMRRLPDDASARRCSRAGCCGPEQLAALAERLAAFLRRRARDARRSVTPDVLRANVDENFARSRPSWAISSTARRSTRCARSSSGGWRARGSLRRARRRGAYPRRPRRSAAGARLFLARARRHRRDRLHRVQRTIPLRRRRRRGGVPGHGARGGAAARPGGGFLARFAEASDDFGLYGVLDFYLSYRAWVRGKVAAFLAADATAEAPCAPQARRGAALLRARALVLRACRSTRRSWSPSAGSSAAARARWRRRSGRALAAPVVSSDRTRKALAGLAPTERGDARLYAPEAVDRTMLELLPRAARAGVRARRHPGRDLSRAAPAGRRRGAGTARGRAVRVPRSALRRRRDPARAARRAPRTAFGVRRHRRRAGPDPATPGTGRRRRAGTAASIDTSREPARALASALRALVEAGIHPAAARRAS